MKILLLGEASNFNWTLAEGLRALGHTVTVASNGSGWMNNNRNIDLSRKSKGLYHSICYITDILYHLKDFRNYDIVQIKNPIFFDLKPDKNIFIFNYLKRNNKKIFLEALGTDYFYVKACLNKQIFRYSDFFIGETPRTYPSCQDIIDSWMGRKLSSANKKIAARCNGIIACLYEYYISYLPEYKNKLCYIPIPIQTQNYKLKPNIGIPEKVRFFIGIQHDRSQLKGTDIMYEVLREIQTNYKNECDVNAVVSVPLEQYTRQMLSSDVLIDQLYSYTPATNALLAMAQGLITVSGAEPEMYDLLHEFKNQPIINILPDKNDIYKKFEDIIKQKENIPQLAHASRAFVEKHHDYIKVAKQYLDFWEKH